MAQESFGTTTVEAEMVLSGATVQIVRFHLDEPTNRVFRRDSHYWLDLCMSSRPEKARGCYSERWGPHRFERLGDILLLPPGETLHIRTDGSGDQISLVIEIERASIDRWLTTLAGNRHSVLIDVAQQVVDVLFIQVFVIEDVVGPVLRDRQSISQPFESQPHSL